jgi:hypothetical protein
MIRSSKQYNKQINIQLKNIISGEMMKGDVLFETNIDGKAYWVFSSHTRPGVLMYAKDAWSIVKGK